MKINSVIISPVLTEKATRLSQSKVYMFWVENKANKNQIRETLEKLYSVKIGRITVSNKKGKTVKVGRKMTPKKQANKKIAYVKVREGKIDIFPQA